MKLGLGAAAFGAKLKIDIDHIRHAESLGFDSCWTAEAYGNDAVTTATWVAAHTTKMKVGTSIMQMPARTPAMTAMTANSLDALSGGRFILGLGPSGPQVAEGWHGVPYGKPLTRTKEYIEILRKIFAREAPLDVGVQLVCGGARVQRGDVRGAALERGERAAGLGAAAASRGPAQEQRVSARREGPGEEGQRRRGRRGHEVRRVARRDRMDATASSSSRSTTKSSSAATQRCAWKSSATSRGAPSRLGASGLAPARSRAKTTSAWRCLQATCSGARPSCGRDASDAPSPRSASAASGWPRSQATWSARLPLPSVASRLAPQAASARTTASEPARAAWWSGGAPSMSASRASRDFLSSSERF